MIELGQIIIRDDASLVEARNKILKLSEDLKFGSICAARLATITSELVRKMLAASQASGQEASSYIKVELGLRDDIFGMILEFIAKGIGSATDLKLLETIFDRVEVSAEGEDSIEVFKAASDPAFDITEELIAREKEEISRLSKEELFYQLKETHDDLKSKTAQLIQTEKLGSVGTMTAGVAHELNNPMMGIINFIQYCIKHTESSDKRYSVLQDAEKEAKRCMGIIESLLTFSRMEKEGEEARQQADCSEILERVLGLVAYRIRKDHISITKHYARHLPKAWMKMNSIQQVFLNLINNAMDAVKENEKKEIDVDVRREGEFVQITITDTGFGIPAANLKKIFDPFFTTKSTGEGTGLGLSIVHGIIEEHGGEITCDSRIGQGTKFTVFLPISLRRRGRE